MSYQAKKRHGGDLDAFYGEKEASLNRPCALYNPISETFWRRHNYGDRRKISVFQGLETSRDKQTG